MSETILMRKIMKAVSNTGTRLFRNNVAMAWVGKSIRVNKPTAIVLNVGDVVIRNARPLHAGLCVGSGDLIGFTPVVITTEMVGKTIGTFTSIEVKEKGKPTAEQIAFMKGVLSYGGIAGIVYSEEEAVKLVQNT